MTDTNATFAIHGITLNATTREAFVDGRLLSLTKTEFRLLHFLASHAGDAHTRKQIIEAVQGADYPVTDRSVDSQIVELRKKLDDRGRLIESIRGFGYRFKSSGA
jgi:two-component system phosphate regulon response regulator PhoB